MSAEVHLCGAKLRGRRSKGRTCAVRVSTPEGRCYRHGGRTPNVVKFKPRNQVALRHGATVAAQTVRSILECLPLEVRQACEGIDVATITDDALRALAGYWLVMLQRHQRGEVSEDALERGLILYTEQITKLDLRRAQIRSSLARAGLDDSTQRGMEAGLELTQRLLAAASSGSRARLEALPKQGNIDRRGDG